MGLFQRSDKSVLFAIKDFTGEVFSADLVGLTFFGETDALEADLSPTSPEPALSNESVFCLCSEVSLFDQKQQM